MSFFVYVIFFFQFRSMWYVCNKLFCNFQKLAWLIIYLDLPSCLPTLRFSINIKHLCLFFHLLPILTDILKFRPPPPSYFDPPSFIRHLRVRLHIQTFAGLPLSWRRSLSYRNYSFDFQQINDLISIWRVFHHEKVKKWGFIKGL